MLSLTLIDDFGLKPLKSPHDEDLHDLIDERYERSATIMTSNLDFSEWGMLFLISYSALRPWIASVTMRIAWYWRVKVIDRRGPCLTGKKKMLKKELK